MVWYNNPESVEAIQSAKREGYSPQRSKLLRLVNTQRHVRQLDH